MTPSLRDAAAVVAEAEAFAARYLASKARLAA